MIFCSVFRGTLPSLHLPHTRTNKHANPVAEKADSEQFEVLQIISTSPERSDSDFESNQPSPLPSPNGTEQTVVDPLRESSPEQCDLPPGPSQSNTRPMSDILRELLPGHSTGNFPNNFEWDTVSLLKALRTETNEGVKLEQLQAKYRLQQKRMSKYRRKLFELRTSVKRLKSRPCKDCENRNLIDRKTVHPSIMSMLEGHEGYDGRSARYLENEKKFAVALYFCSAKTYAILQKHFCLPSVKSLKRWVQEMDLRPEMSKPLIDLLDERSEAGGATTPQRAREEVVVKQENQQVDENESVGEISEQVTDNEQVYESLKHVYDNGVDQISHVDQIGVVDQIEKVDQNEQVDLFDNIMVDIVQQHQSTVLVDSMNSFYILQPILEYIK